MSLIKDTIANLIGGISQQPDKLKFPNQSKEIINYLLSPSLGLKDRPPTEHIARLTNSLNIHPYVHTIIKEDEEYLVILTGDNIKVYDLQGNEKTVSVSEQALNYIQSTEPLKNFTATTIADYTFILNKTVTTELSSTVFTNSYPSSALIFVKQGDYSTDYKISVNGSLVADYTTSSSDVSTTKTNSICKKLYDDLVDNLGTTNWSIQKQGSVICLKKRDGTDFTIQTEDSNADRNLYAFYRTAEALDYLPLVAPNKFILKIIGEDVNKADDYYVKFETSDGSSFGSGTWKECCAPGIKYKLNAETMPVALIRQSNGTFKLKTISWTARKAGDEESSANPSFIGNTIQDIFTHKGRLGFISSDKVIFSDTQDIFSFFKKTTLTELDTDPIDIGSNSKMVLLKHNLPFNEELLLFSETSEFSIKGGDVFSNRTVACDLTMEYPCSRYCKPVNAGSTGFFVFENGNCSRVMEIYITSSYTIDARDITEHVPSFLPKDMYKIASSTANNMACFLSTETPNTIYVYNYYYSSGQKAQSAWSKWYFKNSKILNVDFKENLLYLTVQYSDGIYLEKINLSAQNCENNMNYLFYLDRKIYLNNLEPSNGITTFTLPYNPVNNITILKPNGFPLEYEQNGTTISVQGEYTSLIAGNTFNSIWEMPVIYARQQTANGGLKVREGTLMLRDINLCYINTGYFRVEITPQYSTNISSTFEFTGKILGMNSSTINQLNISSGTFLIPVIAKNEDISINIINDGYMPSCFLSLEWLGDYSNRGR